MSRNRECSVFVGNLEPRVTEEILYELFLQVSSGYRAFSLSATKV